MFKLVVLFSAAALAAAQPGYLGAGLLGAGAYGHGLLAPGYGGLGYGGLGYGGLGLGGLGVYGQGLVAPGLISPHLGLGAPTIYAPGGGSLPHGQPANIIGADGRPLDTIDVNVDRARHLTARVVDASRQHLLKKRSLSPLALAPYGGAVSHTSRIDWPGAALAYRAPLAIGAPLGLGGHIGLGAPHGLAAPYGYGGHWGFAGPLAHAW